ncbi:hypothetical protein [Pseudoxanthomonas suwonensis]|uniref:Secreted protein n=1 Tax=Pseudoxanthomonas suwonensis TaxID=314722 RepID=A0A0E3Z5F7_9GAMM|nr:hypothetical protein [Pseudoxanthomonas suwonensis]AKC88017.1 hypothetical protein WQ53_15825 [Pseudoxanthomonas suwonensis]
MNIKRLCVAVLFAGAAFAAHAADNATLTDCVDLGSDQEIVRGGSTSNFLLRDGDSHYRVGLVRSCDALPIASSVEITSNGTHDRLCPRDSTVKTNRGSCDVGDVETLDAEQFAKLKRRARR